MGRKCNPSWLEKEGVLGYIIDSYRGLEMDQERAATHRVGNRMRRVFEWMEGEEAYRGNAEAFTLHLGLKFGLSLKPVNTSSIHAILRELGEVVLTPCKEREKPKKDSPSVGKFRQPDPEKWRVRG